MGAIHAIGKTYGVLPSDLLLRELEEVELSYLVLIEGLIQEKEYITGKREPVNLLSDDVEDVASRMQSLFGRSPKGVKIGKHS